MNRFLLFTILLFPLLTTAQEKQDRRVNFPKQEVLIKSLPSKKNVWVFIMAGQSNMAGRAFVEPADTLPDSRILTINKDNQLIEAKEPLHFYQPKLTGLDCGVSFARTLLPHLPHHVVILLLPCAVGGSSISYWLSDSIFNGIHLKSNFMDKVQLAKKYGTIKGILWHQGESDAFADRIPVYETRLKILFSFFRQYTGNAKLPILMGELGTYTKRADWRKNWAAINVIIDRVADTEKYCSLVRTADLTPKEDFIHFDSRSQRILGKRFAAAYLRIKK